MNDEIHVIRRHVPHIVLHVMKHPAAVISRPCAQFLKNTTSLIEWILGYYTRYAARLQGGLGNLSVGIAVEFCFSEWVCPYPVFFPCQQANVTLCHSEGENHIQQQPHSEPEESVHVLFSLADVRGCLNFSAEGYAPCHNKQFADISFVHIVSYGRS
ncbi:MAG: hypothetical protein IJX93_10295 [Clostridia bacterium]|nr:hypothetical protein [Clostridia bacterium]